MSNQWHGFVGNLTRDPEVRSVPSKNGDNVTVVSFAVAVNGRGSEDVTFFECEAWAQGAEVIAKWFKKGTPIVVNDAEAKNETWTDKTTGEKRSRLKFRINRFGFCPITKGKAEDEAEAEGEEEAAPAPVPATKKGRPARQPVPVPATEPEEEDEDIPF